MATGAIGLFGVIVYFWPSLTVGPPAAPLEPGKPFTFPVLMNNDGKVDLNDIALECHINDLTNAAAKLRDNHFPSMERSILVAGDQQTVFCRADEAVVFPEHLPPTAADVSVLVSYRARPTPFLVHQQQFRFVAQRTPDGTYHWLRQSSLPNMHRVPVFDYPKDIGF